MDASEDIIAAEMQDLSVQHSEEKKTSFNENKHERKCGEWKENHHHHSCGNLQKSCKNMHCPQSLSYCQLNVHSGCGYGHHQLQQRVLSGNVRNFCHQRPTHCYCVNAVSHCCAMGFNVYNNPCFHQFPCYCNSFSCCGERDAEANFIRCNSNCKKAQQYKRNDCDCCNEGNCACCKLGKRCEANVKHDDVNDNEDNGGKDETEEKEDEDIEGEE